MSGNIKKLCINSFLAGFVLWYGIEKLFMTSIGITALGVAVAIVVLQTCNVVLDIPTGMLADRWSRKGVLLISSLAMIACCLLMAASHSLLLYAFGVALYALHVVTAATTSDALVYDTLQEAGQAERYSKIGGLVGSLNLVGYAAASLLGGFMAEWLGSYRWLYVLAVVPSMINLGIVLTLKEPSYHQTVKGPHPFKAAVKDIVAGSKAVAAVGMLRALITVMCLLWIVEAFKEGFGQLYFLSYVPGIPGDVSRHLSVAAAIGILWAVFYLVWALGEYFASKFEAKLQPLIIATVAPLVAMCFANNWVSLVLFMVQAFLAGALFVQIQARIHDATPSAIRASVMSVRTFMGRLVSIAALPVLGLVMESGGSLWAIRFVTLFGILALAVWFAYKLRARSRQLEACPA